MLPQLSPWDVNTALAKTCEAAAAALQQLLTRELAEWRQLALAVRPRWVGSGQTCGAHGGGGGGLALGILTKSAAGPVPCVWGRGGGAHAAAHKGASEWRGLALAVRLRCVHLWHLKGVKGQVKGLQGQEVGSVPSIRHKEDQDVGAFRHAATSTHY